MRTGANIADTRHAIAIARSYLPAVTREGLTRQALRHHGKYALELAGQMVERRSWASAMAQVRQAWRCSSFAIARGVALIACQAAWTLVSGPRARKRRASIPRADHDAEGLAIGFSLKLAALEADVR
jgi:hypothetical protein